MKEYIIIRNRFILVSDDTDHLDMTYEEMAARQEAKMIPERWEIKYKDNAIMVQWCGKTNIPEKEQMKMLLMDLGFNRTELICPQCKKSLYGGYFTIGIQCEYHDAWIETSGKILTDGTIDPQIKESHGSYYVDDFRVGCECGYHALIESLVTNEELLSELQKEVIRWAKQ